MALLFLINPTSRQPFSSTFFIDHHHQLTIIFINYHLRQPSSSSTIIVTLPSFLPNLFSARNPSPLNWENFVWKSRDVHRMAMFAILREEKIKKLKSSIPFFSFASILCLLNLMKLFIILVKLDCFVSIFSTKYDALCFQGNLKRSSLR